MIKFSVSLALIYSLLTVTITAPALAQEPTGVRTADEARTGETKPAPDLKTILADSSKKYEAEAAEFDPVKAETAYNRRQTQKKGLSTKNKVLIAAVIVGVAALVFVLVKYGKECLRTSPPNCNLGLDDSCYCEEYAPRNP